MDIHDYPPLDFSPADESDGIKKAVLCESEEEAIWLLAAMKVQYPEEAYYWDFPHTSWSAGDEGVYNPTCYRLGIGHSDRMTYCDREYFLEEGFKIIPFCTLSSADRDFYQSDEPIESLFA